MNERVAAGLGVVGLLTLSAMAAWHGSDAAASPRQAGEENVYRSATYGFSFSPPAQLAVKEYAPETVAVGTPRDEEGFDARVRVEVARAEKGAGYRSYDQFLLERGKRLCAAGSPGEPAECTRIAKTRLFRTARGLVGREFYFELRRRDSAVGATATSTFGPVYAFDLSGRITDAPFSALLVYQPLPEALEGEDSRVVMAVAHTIGFNAVTRQ